MTDYGIKLDSIEDALKDIQGGKPVILLDDPGREGEGDFIMAASKVDPEWMRFILDKAQGAFIAVFMPEDHANYLSLPAQVDPRANQESSRTNFRLTCDSKYGHSGCSAAERAQAANILGGRFVPYATRANNRPFDYTSLGQIVERASTPDDLVRPGHLVPIAGNPKGLYARQGHTESGIELMKLAGIDPPVAIDMEILDPTGPYDMGSPTYLRQLADSKDLKVVSIPLLCEYLKVDRLKFK
mgnify:CR=1 FL=1|jgi:3,4-dihydroxy 2-butanone 4-phosphate synthase / GTP cyclohydrolase II